MYRHETDIYLLVLLSSRKANVTFLKIWWMKLKQNLLTCIMFRGHHLGKLEEQSETCMRDSKKEAEISLLWVWPSLCVLCLWWTLRNFGHSFPIPTASSVNEFNQPAASEDGSQLSMMVWITQTLGIWQQFAFLSISCQTINNFFSFHSIGYNSPILVSRWQWSTEQPRWSGSHIKRFFHMNLVARDSL